MCRFSPFDFISEWHLWWAISPPRGDLNCLHSAWKKDSFFCLLNQWNRKHRNPMVGHVFSGPSKLGMKDLLPMRVTILFYWPYAKRYDLCDEHTWMSGNSYLAYQLADLSPQYAKHHGEKIFFLVNLPNPP